MWHSVISVLADSGITVNPSPPPGGDKILTLVSWAGWIAMVGACLALVYNGARFGWDKSHGTGDNQAAGRAAWTLGGCVLIGIAGGLVGALV